MGSIVKFSYYIFDQKVKVLLVKVFMGETNIVLRKNAKDEANLRIDGKQLNTYLKHLQIICICRKFTENMHLQMFGICTSSVFFFFCSLLVLRRE